MYCPKCGVQAKAGSRFCARCGAPLPIETGTSSSNNASNETQVIHKSSPVDWLEDSWQGLLFMGIGIFLIILGGTLWDNGWGWVAAFVAGMVMLYLGIIGLSVPGFLGLILAGTALLFLLYAFRSWAVIAISATVITGGIIYYFWVVRKYGATADTSLSPGITASILAGLFFAFGCSVGDWWIIIIGGLVFMVCVVGVYDDLKKAEKGGEDTNTSGESTSEDSSNIGVRLPAILRRQVVLTIGICASFVLILCIGTSLGLGQWANRAAEVKRSYLSQYSTEVTIKDAFDNFFRDPKWSTYTENDHDYVLFTGTAAYAANNMPADIQIAFYLSDDTFWVDHIEIDGSYANQLQVTSLLENIYDSY